jgi:hypothetical protein
VAALAPTLNRLAFLDLRCTQVNAGVLAVLGGVVDPATLLPMTGTPRLKSLYLSEDIGLTTADVVNLVRLMGLSDVEATIPEYVLSLNAEALLNGVWRPFIRRWKSLGAYVEFGEIDLERDPETQVIGLYFTRDNNNLATNALMATLPPNIVRISLRGTQITNAGLAMLTAARFPALTMVDLYRMGTPPLPAVPGVNPIPPQPAVPGPNCKTPGTRSSPGVPGTADVPALPFTPTITPVGVAALINGLPNVKTVVLDQDFPPVPGFPGAPIVRVP